MAADDKYYMDPNGFSQAEIDYAAAVKTYNETLDKIVAALDGYTGEGKWEGGKANAKFTAELASAKAKLRTIGTNIQTNRKVFASIKGFVNQYDTEVSNKVDNMVN